MTKTKPKQRPNQRNARCSPEPKGSKGKFVATPYEPTPAERAALEEFRARKKEKPSAPRVKVSETAGEIETIVQRIGDGAVTDSEIFGLRIAFENVFLVN